MVRFVRNQNGLAFFEIFVRDGAFFEILEVKMELLNRCEADVDVVSVDAFKVVDFDDLRSASIDPQSGFVEEIFGRERVQESYPASFV